MEDRYRGYEAPDPTDPYDDTDYDNRTWEQKFHDDNTWLKDKGVLMHDGEEAVYWCSYCNAVRMWQSYEGSNVHDRYDYILCVVCGHHGDGNSRNPTEEEIEAYEEGEYDN